MNDPRLVRDYNAISPVVHPREPTGRGPALERLLDYVEPIFENRLPESGYVWGPSGAGKSALIAALFARLKGLQSLSSSMIHTSTRGGTGSGPTVVTIDARNDASDFALYRAILTAVLDESVPDHGIATENLRVRLDAYLDGYDNRVFVVVDHIDEPVTRSIDDLSTLFAGLGDSIAWVGVGRSSPSAFSNENCPPERIELAAYEDFALIDVLTARASEGLARRAVNHEQLSAVAQWAEGNAHDALCALFVAASNANDAGASTVSANDVQRGMNAVSRPSMPLGQVLALPANRQQVLRRLVALENRGSSVSATAEAIVEAPDLGLSVGTVQRILYELASAGVIERVRSVETNGAGRPPSRLEARFPAAVFGRLYDRYRPSACSR